MGRINPHRLYTGTKLLDVIMALPDLSLPAKVLYSRMQRYAQKSGLCYPKQETLALELGVSKRSIIRYIKELIDYELIEVAKDWNANEYFFCDHPLLSCQDVECQSVTLESDNLSPDLTSILEERNNKAAEAEKDTEMIDTVYNAYPSKCPVSGRSTGKSFKNKRTISTLLKKYSSDDLVKAITWYIDDCKKNNSYTKNFSTFLNNIPDKSYWAEKEPEEKPEPIEYKWEIGKDGLTSEMVRMYGLRTIPTYDMVKYKFLEWVGHGGYESNLRAIQKKIEMHNKYNGTEFSTDPKDYGYDVRVSRG